MPWHSCCWLRPSISRRWRMIMPRGYCAIKSTSCLRFGKGTAGGAAFFYSITQGQEADNHLPLEKNSKTAKKCLTKFSPGGIINKLIENSTIQDALVAQLDRVTGYEPVGRGFESLQARQTKRTLQTQCPYSFGALAPRRRRAMRSPLRDGTVALKTFHWNVFSTRSTSSAPGYGRHQVSSAFFVWCACLLKLRAAHLLRRMQETSRWLVSERSSTGTFF